MLVGQLSQPLPQLLLGRRGGSTPIPVGGARQPQDATDRPPGAHPRRHHRQRQFPSMPRAYNSFSHTASNTRFFRSASANIFLSSPFSRSSSLSRRASFTSNCPNCRFQRWKLTSETLYSRQTSRIDLPALASRRIRILSSVVYRLPFILGPFFRPRTNTSGGPKKRVHVNANKGRQ